jgi:alpha-1,2-mannosyltransferase
VHRCLPGPLLVTVAFVAVATWLDPVRTTLYLGQINVVILALVVGDMLGPRGSRWRGVGVGLAAALKLTPLLFVAYLLLTGRIRAAVTAVATFAVAAGVGFLVAPADSVTYWLRGTFAAADRISAVGGSSNHAVSGFVARLLGEGSAAQVTYLAAAAGLVVGTLCLAVRAHREGDEVLAVVLRRPVPPIAVAGPVCAHSLRGSFSLLAVDHMGRGLVRHGARQE